MRRQFFAGVLSAVTGIAVVGGWTFSMRADLDGATNAPGPGTASAARKSESQAAPQATISATVHDFGIMNPLTMGSHVFLVRNDGSAALQLTLLDNTCKCMVSRLPGEPISPGETGRIELQWNTGRNTGFYAHGATFCTNDPGRPTIGLQVRGQVRSLLTSEPAEVVLPKIVPGEKICFELLVFSQVWPDARVVAVHASEPNMRWDVRPASADQLEQHSAKAAQWLTVTLPAHDESGDFLDQLHIEVRRDGGEGSAEVEALLVPVTGRVLRRIAAYGPAIDATGTVHLKARQAPETPSATARLLVKVRDAQLRLPVERIETEPAELHATLEPHGALAEQAGLYDLEVAFHGQRPSLRTQGRIIIQFDHPRIPDLRLKVEVQGGQSADNPKSASS